MRILIIAHNQLEIIKLQIEIIKAIAHVEDSDFIIVDNCSNDGTADWLIEQNNIDYIICDEKYEKESTIINLVFKEFAKDENVLLIKAGVVVLPRCLEVLSQQMEKNEKIGAIFPQLLESKNGSKGSIDEALDFAQKSFSEELYQRIGISSQVVLLSGSLVEAVGGLDENITLSHNVFSDLSFKAVIHDYVCFEAMGVYAIDISSATMAEDVENDLADQKYLRNKWGMNYFNDNPNENMLSLIKAKPDEEISVLEIGCDCGANLLWIKNKYKNSKIYGIEINPISAQIASHLFEVATCDIEKKEVPFENVKYDYIIFGDVLEHLGNPAVAIEFCREILKPNGKVLASIPNLMHYSVVHALLNGDFHYTDTGLLDKTHIHFFTYNEIVRMFNDKKYDILNITYTIVNSNTEKREKIIADLMSVSDNAQKFMFEAFQYIVLAQPQNFK